MKKHLSREELLILSALNKYSGLPVGQISYMARINMQHTKKHLRMLLGDNMLALEKHGGHEYYIIKPVARLILEKHKTAFRSIQSSGDLRDAPSTAGKLSSFATARTCYGHLAGKLGVELTSQLQKKQFIESINNSYILTKKGASFFKSPTSNTAGIFKDPKKRELESKEDSFNNFSPSKKCLDGTERQYHIGGKLGKYIVNQFRHFGWLKLIPGSRVVALTDKGKEQLKKKLKLTITE